MKLNEPKLLKPEVGKYYRTYGGWRALVIWECYSQFGGANQFYLVIHKPKEEDETSITHDYNGKPRTTFSVNEPPTYTEHHPADLKEIWKGKP